MASTHKTGTAKRSYAERVRNGAAFLDRELPGWHQDIDLDRLELSSSCDCVLGQLWGDCYEDAVSDMCLEEDQSWEMGFVAPLGYNDTNPNPYYWLTLRWRQEIRRRCNAPVEPT